MPKTLGDLVTQLAEIEESARELLSRSGELWNRERSLSDQLMRTFPHQITEWGNDRPRYCATGYSRADRSGLHAERDRVCQQLRPIRDRLGELKREADHIRREIERERKAAAKPACAQSDLFSGG